MGIDKTKLTKGQVRKLNALRKSVGNALGEEVFGKWLAQQAAAAAKPDAVAVKIDDDDLLGDADLDRREPDPGRGVHGLEHVVDQLTNPVVHGLDEVVTFDVTHFRRYSGIDVVHPADIAAS